MSSRRISRVEETLRHEISEIIQKEMKDPRIGFVTITSLELSPDLKHLRLYISILGTEKEKTDTLKGLENAKGFIRSEVGKRVRLKYLPEITIEVDRSIDEGMRISELIDRISDDKDDEA